MFYKNLNINGTEYPLAVNITGAGTPTTATEGSVGMIYMDTETGDMHKCVAEGNVWEKIGGSTIEHTTMPAVDLSTSTEIGTWHIYHDTTNDTYDIYGYADVEKGIGGLADVGDKQVWAMTLPLAIPSGYNDIFARKHHPTAQGVLNFDKGGFYFSTYTVTIGADYGYCTLGWYGIGSADNGCKATGKVSFHIHFEAEE